MDASAGRGIPMKLRQSILKPIIAIMAALLALGSVPAGVAAHLGESGHLHVPGDATTHTSSVWCVRFTQDPGVWRPDGESSVDSALMEGTSIIFMDCAEILDGHYTIESYDGGTVSRTTVGEPVIGLPDDSDEVTTDAADTVQPFTVKAWTKHQKKWLQKGDKLAARLTKIRTVQQAKRALGSLQRHLRAETQWLRKNKGRFEPESCVADDKAKWEQRVKQAQKSLNKAVTAMNRGNFAATSTNTRQFGRAWTKVEQIYRIGMCDY